MPSPATTTDQHLQSPPEPSLPKKSSDPSLFWNLHACVERTSNSPAPSSLECGEVAGAHAHPIRLASIVINFLVEWSSHLSNSLTTTKCTTGRRSCSTIQNSPSALFWYKERGNRGSRSSAAMFFSLKGLVSSLLFSTAVFGAAVEHLEKRAQAKGLDVSSRQGNFNWYTVKKAGYSFAYIESTIGNSKDDDTFVVRGAHTSSQTIRTGTSPPSTLPPPMPVSFVVATMLPVLICPLAPIRLPFSSATMEVGVTMAGHSQVLSTSNVRIVYLPPPGFAN